MRCFIPNSSIGYCFITLFNIESTHIFLIALIFIIIFFDCAFLSCPIHILKYTKNIRSSLSIVSLPGGNVGGNGYAVHIAQAEQILLGDAGGIRFQRVTEEQHQIHFVARNAGSNLLHTAQAPGEITVHGQAGSLRQHPSGGAGSNDCVFGQNGTVSSTELQCKLFTGIVCKNGDRHIALSFVPSIVLCVTNNFLIGK